MTDDRNRPGDKYPGQTHPAVAATKCPTCGVKAGEACKTIFGRPTRTHAKRLNIWRVSQQSESKSDG